MKPSGGFELFVRHGGLSVAEFGFKEFESLPHGFSWFVPQDARRTTSVKDSRGERFAFFRIL